MEIIAIAKISQWGLPTLMLTKSGSQAMVSGGTKGRVNEQKGKRDTVVMQWAGKLMWLQRRPNWFTWQRLNYWIRTGRKTVPRFNRYSNLANLNDTTRSFRLYRPFRQGLSLHRPIDFSKNYRRISSLRKHRCFSNKSRSVKSV